MELNCISHFHKSHVIVFFQDRTVYYNNQGHWVWFQVVVTYPYGKVHEHLEPAD